MRSVPARVSNPLTGTFEGRDATAPGGGAASMASTPAELEKFAP